MLHFYWDWRGNLMGSVKFVDKKRLQGVLSSRARVPEVVNNVVVLVSVFPLLPQMLWLPSIPFIKENQYFYYYFFAKS
jgi:hypothetical protein